MLGEENFASASPDIQSAVRVLESLYSRIRCELVVYSVMMICRPKNSNKESRYSEYEGDSRQRTGGEPDSGTTKVLYLGRRKQGPVYVDRKTKLFGGIDFGLFESYPPRGPNWFSYPINSMHVAGPGRDAQTEIIVSQREPLRIIMRSERVSLEAGARANQIEQVVPDSPANCRRMQIKELRVVYTLDTIMERLWSSQILRIFWSELTAQT